MSAWDDVLACLTCCRPPQRYARAQLRTDVQAMGYAPITPSGGNEEAQAVTQEVAEETALVRYERRVLAYDELAAQCLPVARVVDLGNGYVRCVLR